MDIIGFEKIAPHLGNPLVLAGFVLMQFGHIMLLEECG